MALRDLSGLAAAALLAGCAPQLEAAAPAAGALPAAPWAGLPLRAAEVPSVHIGTWRAAENRVQCAPLAFAGLDPGSTGTARAATFSGGWGVAYDRPGLRSAYGVAGAGVLAADASYDNWPHRRSWADGSTAGYGPEGGSGPSQLAYLRIAGQGCLYNVWSRLGREHLERLLEAVRFVAVPETTR
jgi:hypothetical protein